MTRFRLAFAAVLLGLVLSPTLASGQGETRTHTVKKGDTLWDLAQQYLGDPFKWPDIYRLNTATVQDPNLIYPEQIIIISGQVAATPGTPPDVPTEPVAPADPTMPGDTAAPEVPAEPELPPPAMTIFHPDRYRSSATTGRRESFQVRPRAAALRPGDYLQAPFLWDRAGVTGAGRVDQTTNQDGIGSSIADRPIQLYERIYVQVPAGSEGLPDERFLVFRYGPVIEGRGKVVIPTGVLKLETATVNGRAQGIILTKFEDVFSGQLLMPLDTLTLPNGVFPTRVEFGLATTIAYIYGDPVLPPIGHQLIFSAGSGDGLAPGDQLTIQRRMGVDERGAPLPPEDIAVAQVTRVTPWGASAIVIGQTDGGMARGTPARVTAKMP